MTFQEAEEKLKEISGGYRCLDYARTTNADGTITTDCLIYTAAERTWDRGRTWEEAFATREKRVSKPIQEPPDVEIVE